MTFNDIPYRYELALAVFVIVPIVLVARVPHRFLWPVVVLWLFSPVAVYWGWVIAEFAARPDQDSNNLANAVTGFMIISAFVLVPWLIVWGLALLLALVLRPKARGVPLAAPLASLEVPQPAVQPEAAEVPPVAPDLARVDALYTTTMRIAAELQIDKRVLPFEYYPDNGAAYAFADAAGYHLAFYDRGQGYERLTTQDLSEIIYWMFDLATFQLASEVAARTLTHADQFGPLVLEGQEAMLRSMPYDWHERWLTDTHTRAAFYRKQGEQR